LLEYSSPSQVTLGHTKENAAARVEAFVTVWGMPLPQSMTVRAAVMAAVTLLLFPGLLFLLLPLGFLLSPLLFLATLFALPIGIAVFLLQKFCRHIDQWVLQLGESLHQKSTEARAAFEAGWDNSFGPNGLSSPVSVIDDLVRLSDYHAQERKMTQKQRETKLR